MTDEHEVEAMVVLRAGMTAKQAATLLAAAPPTWRLHGQADGTVAIGPRGKPDVEDEA